MNKYCKALENIQMIILDSCSDGYREPKFLKDFYYNECESLKELVDKATPKKVVKISQKDYIKGSYEHCCPSCSNCVGTILEDSTIEEDDYCPTCGQRLDWRKK